MKDLIVDQGDGISLVVRVEDADFLIGVCETAEIGDGKPVIPVGRLPILAVTRLLSEALEHVKRSAS